MTHLEDENTGGFTSAEVGNLMSQWVKTESLSYSSILTTQWAYYERNPAVICTR